MKKISLFTVGLMATSLLGGVVANADTAVNSTGRVNVSELTTVEPGNPDPENPEEEIIDPEITIPEDSRFSVIHASDFNFGEIEANGREQVVRAALVDVTTSNGETGKRTPWVTTYDMRNSTDRSAWTLTVAATDLEDGSGHILRGAYISLENLNYAGDSERAPEVQTGRIKLGQAAQDIATATVYSTESDTNDTGVGTWSLALGKSDGEVTDGVALNIPGNIVINDNVEYTASLTWDMTITP